MGRSSLLLLGVCLLVLSACGDSSSSGGSTSGTAPGTPPVVETETGVSTLADGDGGTPDDAPRTGGPLPAPEPDQHTIAWSHAKRLLARCQVRELFQAHSLYVELTLNDGRKLNTREPQIDDVLHLQEALASRCGGVPAAVE